MVLARIDDDDVSEDTQVVLLKAATDWMTDHYKALSDSLLYENAYKMSYIRNFMWAIWQYENNGGNDYDGVFMPAFRNRFFSLVDKELREAMDPEAVSEQLAEGGKLDDYMHTLTWYYLNRLCNLADGGDRNLASNNSPEHHKLLQLHRKLEDEGQFDEILMIRSMLMYLVMGAFRMLLNGDEAASRVFQIDAFEMLNEMNSKPLMVA